MKVGDKYICKRSQRFLSGGSIIENSYYIIDNVDENWIGFHNESYDRITLNDYCMYSKYFYNNFYNKQEERKFKLDKLNESRL